MTFSITNPTSNIITVQSMAIDADGGSYTLPAANLKTWLGDFHFRFYLEIGSLVFHCNGTSLTAEQISRLSNSFLIDWMS